MIPTLRSSLVAVALVLERQASVCVQSATCESGRPDPHSSLVRVWQQAGEARTWQALRGRHSRAPLAVVLTVGVPSLGSRTASASDPASVITPHQQRHPQWRRGMAFPAGSGTGSRPLLYPVAAWNGHAPTHAITCIAVADANADADGPPSSSGAPSATGGHMPPAAHAAIMTGSESGELVGWESRPSRSSGSAVGRLRPRALCFHSGAARVTGLCFGTVTGGAPTGATRAGVFVAASSEGFLSVWSAAGGRCRRSALVLPFGATFLRSVYACAGPDGPQLSLTPPASTIRATCYVVCAAPSSGHVYIVRLPRLQVVAILGTRPVLAASMSEAPGAGGPTLSTLDAHGVVSLWKLTDYFLPRFGSAVSPKSRPRGIELSSPNSSPQSHSFSPPPLSQLPPLTLGDSAHPQAQVSISASAIYIANGVPLYSTPASDFRLPLPTPSNIMRDLFHAPAGALDPQLSAHSYSILPPMHHTSIALSPFSTMTLVTSAQHFMLVRIKTAQLEMPIQSMAMHIDRMRHAHEEATDQGPTLHSRQDPSPLTLLWSDSDELTGCCFLPVVGATQRFAVWSDEGGIWVFQLHIVDASGGGSRSPGPSLGVRLFAVCCLADLHVCSEEPPQLLVPSTIRVDGNRILAGNVAGAIYEYAIPIGAPAPPAELQVGVEDATSIPVHSDHSYDAASGVWHVHPSQVVSVASAFSARPLDAQASMPTETHPTLQRSASLGALDEITPRFVVRPDDDEPANAGSFTSTLSSARLAHLRAHSLSRAQSFDNLSSVATPTDDVCTASCMLVDARRKHVVLARGFRSGVVHLICLAGPVHGAQSVAFSQGADGSSRLELPLAHSAEVSCMLSLDKRAGDGVGVVVILVTGSMDGSVATWEMHTGRMLHRFRCGRAVLAIHQPIVVPTIAALVQAQTAGMLYPSTSDRVPASHQLPTSPPASSHGQPASPALILNADMYDSSALSHEQALDYHAIYQLPPNELLFIVCADRSVRSVQVQAHDNASLGSHINASSHATELAPSVRLERRFNEFVQVYRGHSAPVRSVFYNSWTAERDLLVTQTEQGSLAVWCASTGELEQTIDDAAEVVAFLQTNDLVHSHSQLSLMAFQLRQLAAFAPGLFQLATDANASLTRTKQEAVSTSGTSTGSPPSSSASASHVGPPSWPRAAPTSSATLPTSASKTSMMGLRAVSLAKLAMKRVSSTLRGRRRSGGSAAATELGLVFGSSSLGSSANYATAEEGQAVANQSHVLATYIINRFLFHQQNPSFNASILSAVVNGVGQPTSGESMGPGNSSAAIVYRPSVLKRSSLGPQALKSVDLHLAPAHSGAHLSATNRFNHLQLSVYALDVQRVVRDLLTRYAALKSSTGHHRTGSGGDAKRDGQAAWHSLLSPLFDWDDGPGTIGAMLKMHLNMQASSTHQTFAVFSDRAQALTVLFPSHSHSHRRWCFDPEATALHMLSLSSVLLSLSAAADSSAKTTWEKVISYYHFHLPRQMPGYAEADLTFLSLYALNQAEHVHQAARTLLQGLVERSSEEQRAAWWREWSIMFQAHAYGNGGDAFWRRNLFPLALLKRDESSTPPTASGVAVSVAAPLPAKKGLSAASANVSNLFKRKSHGPESPLPVSPSPGLHAPSPPSSLSPPSPLLPEFVSDKEFMAAFVLSTIYTFEHNLCEWHRRETTFGAGAQVDGQDSEQRIPLAPSNQVAQGDPVAIAGSQSSLVQMYAALASVTPVADSAPPSLSRSVSDGAFPSLLAEMESRVPLVVHTLLRQLAYNSHVSGPIIKPTEVVKLALACDILAQGLVVFLRFIPVESLALLICRLHVLSLNSNLVEKAFNGAPGVSRPPQPRATPTDSPLLALNLQLYNSARRLLLELGKHRPELYSFTVGKEVLLRQLRLSAAERIIYIGGLVNLVRKYPRAVNSALLDLAHTLIKLLKPGESMMRAHLMPAIMDVLRSVDSLYSQASLNEASSLLAIGSGLNWYHSSHDDGHSVRSAPSSAGGRPLPPLTDVGCLMGTRGVVYRPQRSVYPFAVVVFDLKTGNKWRILTGHSAEVTAVAINPSGTLVASYCARDHPQATLRVWSLGSAGFLSDLVHSHGKVVKSWLLPTIDLDAIVCQERFAVNRQAYLNRRCRATTIQGNRERGGAGLHVPAHTLTPSPLPPVGSFDMASAGGLGAPLTTTTTSLPPQLDLLTSVPEDETSPGLSPPFATPLRAPPSHRPPPPPPSSSMPSPSSCPLAAPSFSPSAPSASSSGPSASPGAAFASLPLAAVSSVQLDEGDDTLEDLYTTRMLAVRLRWSPTGDAIVLTREDQTTFTFDFAHTDHASLL